jgi:hypothetical protein
LHARDTWTVEDLAERLRDTGHRLDELRLGGRTVDAGESQRRMFRLLAPHHRHVPVDDLPPGLPLSPGFADAEAAFVVAAIEPAAEPEPSISWRPAAAFWSALHLGKRWDDWVSTHRITLAAAARDGSAEGQAWILNHIGLAYGQRARERWRESAAAIGGGPAAGNALTFPKMPK